MFIAGSVEVDGARIGYREAGQGPPVLHVPGRSGLALTPAHDLLCRQFRVIALDEPASSRTIAEAAWRLDLERFNLVATGSAATTALALALDQPDRVLALVLAAPAAGRDADLERRLPSLATPTLVLHGTRDSTGAVGPIYQALMPNCHRVFVYDATDAIAAERPEAFAEVVADFLERHEAFVISRGETVIYP